MIVVGTFGEAGDGIVLERVGGGLVAAKRSEERLVMGQGSRAESSEEKEEGEVEPVEAESPEEEGWTLS